MSDRYSSFQVAHELVDFLLHYGETQGLIYIRGAEPEPDSSQFQLASGVVLLISTNSFISGMLTPWGIWMFARCALGRWGDHLPVFVEKFGLREFRKFSPVGHAYTTGVTFQGYEVTSLLGFEVPNAVLLQPETFLKPEDALVEWVQMTACRRIEQIRPQSLVKSA